MGAGDIPAFPEFRLTDDPARLTAAAVGVLVVLGIVVVLRVLGGILNDPVHPVTYAALVGGALGALAMAGLMQAMAVRRNLPSTEFLATGLGGGVGDAGAYIYAGMVLHVVYGAVAAGVYPWVMRDLIGLRGQLFVAFPLSPLFTVVFGLVLFGLGSLYGVVGLIDLRIDPRAAKYQLLFVLHLGYGVTLGAVLGIWWFVKPMVL